MQENTLTMKNSDLGDDTSPLGVGGAAVSAGATGLMLPSVAALPEAFERYPKGAEMLAWLFIAWLVYRIIIALITSLSRRK